MAAGARWVWPFRKQLIGLPSYFGVMIFIMAGLKDNWWVGLPIFLIILAAYDRLYDSVTRSGDRLVTAILKIAGLTLFQIVYWALVFLLANQLLNDRL